MTIFYKFDGQMYINITNGCPCDCVFCLRNNSDSVKDNGSLWLEHEPSFEEIVDAYEKFDKTGCTHAIFCGYGEPMERAEDVVFIGKELKKRYPHKIIRLNTNGLSDKIHGRPTAAMLEGAVDIVSISLNSGNEKDYNAVTRPKWEDSFSALLSFAQDCKKYVPQVMFTVVDVISEREIEESKEISERLGIPLRIRKYDT